MEDGHDYAAERLGTDDARRTALLCPHTREADLSPGDRACLAPAARLGHVAVTADRAWKNVDGLALDGDVIRTDLIRGRALIASRGHVHCPLPLPGVTDTKP